MENNGSPMVYNNTNTSIHASHNNHHNNLHSSVGSSHVGSRSSHRDFSNEHVGVPMLEEYRMNTLAVGSGSMSSSDGHGPESPVPLIASHPQLRESFRRMCGYFNILDRVFHPKRQYSLMNNNNNNSLVNVSNTQDDEYNRSDNPNNHSDNATNNNNNNNNNNFNSPEEPMGQGNDGVFSNLTAKPESLQERRERTRRLEMLAGMDGGYEDYFNNNRNTTRQRTFHEDMYAGEFERQDKPPTYEEASSDAVPPYWDLSPESALYYDEICIDGLPAGNLINFLWNCAISSSFNNNGYDTLDTFHSTLSHGYEETNSERNKYMNILAIFLFIIGTGMIFHSIYSYCRIKRIEKSLMRQQESIQELQQQQQAEAHNEQLRQLESRAAQRATSVNSNFQTSEATGNAGIAVPDMSELENAVMNDSSAVSIGAQSHRANSTGSLSTLTLPFNETRVPFDDLRNIDHADIQSDTSESPSLRSL
ncbi:hypothetical protein ACO0QE_004764 [Hanseniaspora vineae]